MKDNFLIPINLPFITTNHKAVNDLSLYEKKLLSSFGETWYDNREIFDTDFFNLFFETMNTDPFVSINYVLSTDEKRTALKLLNESVTYNTKEIELNKKIIDKINNDISNIDNSVIPAINIITNIKDTIANNMELLVILDRPEANFGSNLDNKISSSIFHNSDLKNNLKNNIHYYEGFSGSFDKPTGYLNPQDFSFKFLKSLGCTFGYETPVFTTNDKKEIHKFYWEKFSIHFYTKLLSNYKNLEVITVGCSPKFDNMIKSLCHVNNSFHLSFSNSLFNDKSINTDAVSKLGITIGEFLGNIDNKNSNKILTYD